MHETLQQLNHEEYSQKPYSLEIFSSILYVLMRCFELQEKIDNLFQHKKKDYC